MPAPIPTPPTAAHAAAFLPSTPDASPRAAASGSRSRRPITSTASRSARPRLNPRHAGLRTLLLDVLSRHLTPSARRWLKNTAASIENGARDARLVPAFSAVPERTGTGGLSFAAVDLNRARALGASWSPDGWNVDEAARVVLLLSLPTHDRADLHRRLRLLRDTDDPREAAAVERGIELLSDRE